MGQVGYAGKRDRYNGYDTAQYKLVIDEWEGLNEEQRKKKEREAEEKGNKEGNADNDQDSDSSDLSDPDKEKGEED